MKKIQFKSPLGILLFVVLPLVVILAISGIRLDLTKEKRYTLSDNTVKVLESVNKPLVVDVYLEGDFPASFKQLQSETKFMLEEFRKINPKIDFKFIDPIKTKMSKDTLMAMGMQPSMLPDIKDGKVSQIMLFPYAVVKYDKRGVSIPLVVQQTGIDADQQLTKSIENLEYNLVSNIKNIAAHKRKKIGILVNQDELNPREFQGFMQLATESYDAGPIIPKNQTELTIADIPTLKQMNALVIAKPRKAFTDGEKVILDQYIMNGGKTLWMIDAVNAEMDTLMRSQKVMPFPVDINMTDFFFNYGIRINPALVKDVKKFALLRLVTGEVSGNPQYTSLPWPYFPLGIAESNNPITKNINPVKFEFPTSIDTLGGRKNIKTNVLFESSERTLLKQVPNYVDLKEISSVDSLGQMEKPSTPKIYAVSLEGKFNSAYASRIERKSYPNFKSSSPENKMIVIADGDVGRNKVLKGEPLPLGVDLLTNEQFGNEQFLRNALDYLLDDSNLMDLRNRNIEERLLDRQRITEEKNNWQWFNLLLPLVIIGILGGLFFWLRKKKFG
ncbi:MULTISPECIES: gliding motility-associated ABC transporter substrate-binding protein GldG [Chryseobacterium]|uniref:gliding motility-associated ABC transporter substrate-binding protein GldG n=1 Tax=Chryseobacterium TaxID=59732 RepID=UPI000D3C7344|nr:MULTISPECIES: gliding motility-associated ABC transporter substrate-binding protein GldG [Chryseobacterium]PTT77371.1 gliding motility-associated ABC transporter substrate-binding protein GldG [Chryseobacterium sp. HMWF001]PVV61444.1 gliding motility-associated ABC transporter substrate-binding protein GldG [Chryseobacterium sp. HMWF035]WBV54717.1 gliding motility-associated ABC transporter substrate-binding protein GldG [Chryseobacterium gambrini]WBX99891.1 gliding motility-associated ABC t